MRFVLPGFTIAVIGLLNVTPLNAPVERPVACCGMQVAKVDGDDEHFVNAKDKIIPDKNGKLIHFRGYVKPSAEVLAKRHADAYARHGWRMWHITRAATPPAAWDAVAQGWVPPIRDQGSCGSCYLVSAADAETCCFVKAGYQKADDSFNIAAQYGMDCKNFGGCGGGDEGQVIDFMKTNGFPAERYMDGTGKSVSDYPNYQASSGQCRLKAGAKLWQLADWGYVGSNQGNTATVAEIKAALMQFGVLSVALDASNFDSYNGGVLTNLGRSIDHAITIVGWDDSKGKTGALKLRNQWSSSWGASGYLWVAYEAVPQLTEIIWLTATALPPPPPPPPPPPAPPVPPGPTPTPGNDITVVLKSDGTYVVSGGILVTPNMTFQQILDNAKKLDSKAPINPMPSTTLPVPSMYDESRLKALEDNQARLVAVIEQLQKTIGAQKK